VANSHRRNNLVDSLVINGSMNSDSTKIREHIMQFYKRLYAEQFRWRPKLDGLSFPSIDADERNWLERDFEENEVWEVVRYLNGDKTPGHDGFFMASLKKCWEVVKEDILVVFKELHSQQKFEESFNTISVFLIPKKAGTIDNKDFWPISLVGGVNKIFFKVLANRLKSVLGKIISNS